MGDNNWKDPHHRAAVGLLQKAVFGAKLDVAQPAVAGIVGRTADRVGNNDMKLEVGRRTVVVFEVGQRYVPAVSRFRLLRRYVELVMLIFDRLGIVREKRWPAHGWARSDQQRACHHGACDYCSSMGVYFHIPC